MPLYETAIAVIGENTKSSIAPSNPQKGAFWDEIDPDGNLVMSWWWDGTYWRTRQVYLINYWSGDQGNLQNGSPNGIGTSRIYFNTQFYATKFKFFLLRIDYDSFVSPVNNGSNYWIFGLQKRNATHTIATSFGDISTASHPVNSKVHSSTVVNAVVNFDSVVDFFAIKPMVGAGAPGILGLSMTATLQLIR